jgi:hypothetical protein
MGPPPSALGVRRQRSRVPWAVVRWSSTASPGVIALGARLGDAGVDVVTADRPAHQPRAVERVEAERARHRGDGLVRVGGNDLQVHALAEAKERVVGAQPLVLAAGLRPHPEAALELVHAVRQHGDAIDQVVNHAHPPQHRRPDPLPGNIQSRHRTAPP